MIKCIAFWILQATERHTDNAGTTTDLCTYVVTTLST